MNCPKCGSKMETVRCIPGKGTSEVREFRCPKCLEEKAVLYRDGKVDDGK